MIELTDVSKSFDTKHGIKDVLKDINFKIETGKTTALVGANGAGKTTLLRMISGLNDIDSGTIKILGEELSSEKLTLRKKIGVLFGGETGLYPRLTAREHFLYFGHLYDVPTDTLHHRISELSTDLEMHHYLDERVNNFSKGMKQKVAIGKTMIHDPDIFLFDEPTSGLDIKATDVFTRKIGTLKKAQKTVLFSTHNIEEVTHCDNIVILKGGRVNFNHTLDQLIKMNPDQDINQTILDYI